MASVVLKLTLELTLEALISWEIAARMYYGSECLLVTVVIYSALLLTTLAKLEAGIIWLVWSSVLLFLSSYLLHRIIKTVHILGMWSQLYFWAITFTTDPKSFDKIIWPVVLAFMLSLMEGSGPLCKYFHWFDTQIGNFLHSCVANSLSVGCIYASKPFNSSLIYYQRPFPLQFYYQTSKTTEIFFFYFSCIFTDIIFMSFVFSMLLVIQWFVSFPSPATFDSGLRKHLPTHWLYPTIWLPDGQGGKVLGKQVYASETHSHIL